MGKSSVQGARLGSNPIGGTIYHSSSVSEQLFRLFISLNLFVIRIESEVVSSIYINPLDRETCQPFDMIYMLQTTN